MATVRQLIEGAMRRIGVLDSDRDLSGSDLATALRVAEELLQFWSMSTLDIPGRTIETFTSVFAGGNMATMGTGGDLNTTRPIKIDIINGIGADGSDFPIVKSSAERWFSIRTRNITTRPRYWYAEYNTDYVRIRFDSVPEPTESIRILSWKPFSALGALTATLSFPPGYDRALRLNLAVDLAGEFGVPIDADLKGLAREAKREIENLNQPLVEMSSDPALLFGTGSNDLSINDLLGG